MKIELVNNSTSNCNETSITSVAQFALIESGIHPDSELSIQIVTEEIMSELHMKWMNLPGPTDVLSFPMDEMKPNSATSGPGIVGDLVLCPSYAEKNGKQTLEKELELLMSVSSSRIELKTNCMRKDLRPRQIPNFLLNV